MKSLNSPEKVFKKLADLTAIIRKKIDNETDVFWSRYDSVQHLINDLDREVDRLKIKDHTVLRDLEILFAPTGSLQEISISNGWSDEFLVLAQEFDHLYEQIKQASLN